MKIINNSEYNEYKTKKLNKILNNSTKENPFDVFTVRTIKELLDKKADPNVQNENYTLLGKTVIDRNLPFAKLIINSGADVNIKMGQNEQTALMLAIGLLDENMIKLLIQSNSSLNIKDKNNLNAFDYANKEENFSVRHIVNAASKKQESIESIKQAEAFKKAISNKNIQSKHL